MKARYRAIAISDGSTDGTGENWNEVRPEDAQMWAVEDTDETQPWIVEVYATRADAEAAANQLNQLKGA